MMRKLIFITFMVLLLGCQSKGQFNNFDQELCYDDGYNVLKVALQQKNDTIFFIYINIVDKGNYINGYEDLNDYAGYFMKDRIKNNKISFKIKNYRFEDEYYNLNLDFDDKENKISWYIPDDQSVSYLPNKAILRECSE